MSPSLYVSTRVRRDIHQPPRYECTSHLLHLERAEGRRDGAPDALPVLVASSYQAGGEGSDIVAKERLKDISGQIYRDRYIRTDISGRICQDRHIRTDISGQVYQDRYIRADISGQIYQDRYIRADISGQIYQDRYIRTDISGQIYQGRYIRADISGQIYQDRYIRAGPLIASSNK